MRSQFLTRSVFSCALTALLMPQGASAAGTGGITSHFEHIVIIIQENRTPDNLFYSLCSVAACNTDPHSGAYDIQTAAWANKLSPTGTTVPQPVALDAPHGQDHSYPNFAQLCDPLPGTRQCRMDGEAAVPCQSHDSVCPPLAGFAYVDNSTHAIDPYITLALQYGWANHMFQTSEGQSWPAHQFLFAGTSAPSPADDALGIYASEDPIDASGTAGCISPPSSVVQLIEPEVEEKRRNTTYPCFEHQTLADLLTQKNASWSYYTADYSGIWNAPAAIDHICQPVARKCTGPMWANDKLPNTRIFDDIAACKLSAVSWVTPTQQDSDHPQINTGGGPSWVTSVVNAIGTSPCKDERHRTYWQTTAVLIMWDDWGGWYDHVPAPIEKGLTGDYQLGARVPFLFVSAFTPRGLIVDNKCDYGSINRFIERNFGITEGALGFADARSTDDLAMFYDFGLAPRAFAAIPAPLDAQYFIAHNKTESGTDD